MSFISPDPSISVSALAVGNPGGTGGTVVGGIHTGDVLAFTGAGPGTFYLAIIGFVTLAAGLLATFFSRRSPTAPVLQAPVNGLDDLSLLADQLDRPR